MAKPQQANPEGQAPAKIDGRSREGRALRAAADAPAAVGRMIDEDGPHETITRAGVAPPRSARQPTRPIPAREVDREPERRGATIVTGRDGEVLQRRRTSVGDIYHLDPSEIPADWDYQWNTYTVLNQQATDSQVLMHANGWRPVPASRHPGRWTQPGDTGAIVVGGMRLEERPTALGDQARAEDKAKARTQMRDQTDSLRLTEKLPQGMSTNRKYRGAGADVRITIDKNIDIPRPQHEIEE